MSVLLDQSLASVPVAPQPRPDKAAEAARTSALVTELTALAQRLAPKPGAYETKTGLTVHKRTDEKESACAVYKPSISLIISGRKVSLVGNRRYEYGAGDVLVTLLDMPALFVVLEASEANPFLSLAVPLDAALVRELLPTVGSARTDACPEACNVHCGDPEIMEAFLRLLRLAERPEDANFMAPMLMKEIHYRLLCGPCGDAVRQIVTADSRSNRIVRAVEWLQAHFRDPLSIEELAELVHMAPSTFHRHFKAVTSLSPLQYHKRLRLQEARRLMMAEQADAAAAGYAVGYTSATQFSREYKRLFGAPPKQSVKRIEDVSP